MDSGIASHPAAPVLILSIPRDLFLMEIYSLRKFILSMLMRFIRLINVVDQTYLALQDRATKKLYSKLALDASQITALRTFSAPAR